MKSSFRNSRVFTTGRRIAAALGLQKPLRFIFNTLVLSRSTQAANLGGLTCRFLTPSFTVREYVENFTGEEEILRHLVSQLVPGDVVWDVGAAFGMYAVFAARQLGSKGQVLAFEPEPGMRRLLARNIRLNSLENIRVLPLALGAEDTEGEIFPSDSPNVGTSALAQRTDFPLKLRGVRVPVRRGDSMVSRGEIPPPTVLKVDAEGAEAVIFAGLPETLAGQHLRLVYCEVHPSVLPLFHATPDEIERAITAAGFHIVERHPRGTEYHLICSRHAQ